MVSSRGRIAVASVIQETNTFSLTSTNYSDFESQGLWFGDAIFENTRGLNVEINGALTRLKTLNLSPIPIIRAWAMSGGTLTEESFNRLRQELRSGLKSAGDLDGVILNLHGALVSETEFQCDARIVEDVRELLGKDIPIVVTHDLHANVTSRIVAAATAVIGFRTYPHIDQGDTGARAADLMSECLAGHGAMRTSLTKVNMLIPAEVQSTENFPMKVLRDLADEFIDQNILDISLFPVQPWLDVPELGFGILITHLNSEKRLRILERNLVRELWNLRKDFSVKLVPLSIAIKQIQESKNAKPYLLVQSSDSPTSGATADDASVLDALLRSKPGFSSVMTLVDAFAVQRCLEMGEGSQVELMVGSSIDPRWSKPVLLTGKIIRTGRDAVVLTGPVMRGQEISMGQWATVDSGCGVQVLLTERPAPTFDPSAYRHVGIELESCRAIHVRSANLFRSGYADLFEEAFILDLKGASTAKFDSLNFNNIPHPMYPIDADVSLLEEKYA
jgi:microcystin degradation protein MlrC